MFSYSLIGWCYLFVYFVSHVCIISSINKITELHVRQRKMCLASVQFFVISMHNEQWEANIWCSFYQIETCHLTCWNIHHNSKYRLTITRHIYNFLLQPNVRISMVTNCTWIIFFVLRSTHIIFGIHHQTNPKTCNFLTCYMWANIRDHNFVAQKVLITRCWKII